MDVWFFDEHTYLKSLLKWLKKVAYFTYNSSANISFLIEYYCI